jgi:DNA mismatch repair ATPase MutS
MIIKKLDTITDFMNLCFSSLHFIINMITLWDFHCLFAVDKWKRSAGIHLRQWLKVTGELESISSLALIHHDNQGWTMPELVTEKNIFSAMDAGHPLISGKTRINNDINIIGSGNIHIITGSNMSGKSTLLRTAGINLVLSYAGAPVCASGMKCSVMNIYSSMRISDNLEKNISSFYAELVRIRMILEASKSPGQMIFLLDEIFRGTNSRERKIGAVAVLKELSERGVCGLVATHDLELAELSSVDEKKFENYFFRESFKDNEISFDYKMRKGVSDTMNAVYLMKMIGIDVK